MTYSRRHGGAMNERTLLDVVLEDVQAAEHEEGYTVISFEEQIEY